MGEGNIAWPDADPQILASGEWLTWQFEMICQNHKLNEV